MNLIKSIKNKLDKLHLFLMSPSKRHKWLRKRAYHVGKNVVLATTDFGGEPYLLSIGDNVTVAYKARFITHDASIFHIKNYKKQKKYLDKVGSIVIKDNAFIGAYSILLPNSGVGKNSILAAGSVLTKNIPDGEVWGGNPARFIMTIDEYSNRMIERNIKDDYPWIDDSGEIIKDTKKLIKLRQKYYFEGTAENDK